MSVYDDPNFVKALKLLHSSAPDSANQIMGMLEEAIEQKYGGAKSLNIKLRNILEETTICLEPPKTKGSRGPSPILLGPSEKSSRSSTPPSESVSIRTSPDHDDDDDNLALQIFEDDFFCTVCKGIRVTQENRLLECSECRSLYHQECHKPPVENDVDDPRLVWCCADCTKKMQEKAAVKVKISEPPPKKHKSESEKSSSSSSHKRSSSDKSSHSKSHGSSSSSSKQSSSSSSKSESRSKSSGSTLTFNKTPGSPNGKGGSAPAPANIMAADKRLQNMKKKAAAKMQEKRK